MTSIVMTSSSMRGGGSPEAAIPVVVEDSATVDSHSKPR